MHPRDHTSCFTREVNSVILQHASTLQLMMPTVARNIYADMFSVQRAFVPVKIALYAIAALFLICLKLLISKKREITC